MPDGLERALQQRAERRFDKVAEHQGGDRDADLGRGELGGEPAQRRQHDAGTDIAVVDGPLHRGAVERDQTEFRGDEESGAERSARPRRG